MLKAIRIRNFKSFRHEARLPLGHLTLLIGANASGKSNALEAIRLLKWIGEGQRLGNIRYQIQDSDSAIRGRVQDLFFDITQPLGLGCDFEFGDWRRFDLGLAFREQDNELHVASEGIYGSKPPFLYEVAGPATFPGTDIQVAYNNFARGGTKPQITCSDQMGVFTQLLTPARFNVDHRKSQQEIPDVCGKLLDQLFRSRFLDPMPQFMRGYEAAGDKELTETGGNASSVLCSMIEEIIKFYDEKGNYIREHKEPYYGIMAFLESIPEQRVSDIRFLRTPRNEVMLQLTEKIGESERTFDAAVLSDGTLRILAVAAALFSAPEGGTVIIEEIDNGIHPSRADGLMAKIHDIAVERNLNVVLSSHNPALMDAVPDAALPDTVFVYRDPDEGDSRMVRLGDLHRYPDLVSQGPLGHLVTRGVVDRMVKDKTLPEDRTQAALDWLRKLG